MQSSNPKISITKLLRPANTFTLSGYLFAFMLSILVAGCGGGGGGEVTLDTGAATPVVAKTGPILAARVGEIPVLDGNNSFTLLSSSVSYSWSFTHRPDGSKAILQGATSPNPTFFADTKGVYAAQLLVSAGGVTSQRAIQIVVVTQPGEQPTGPSNHAGLSSDCVNCHDGVLIDPGKSPDHIATTNMCQACHTPQAATIIHFADHQEVFGNCSQCHDGVTAIGKSDTHPLTEAECDNCHNTNSFLALALDGSFDHTGITGGCSGCHNSKVAIGKHDIHIITDVDCVSCHTTNSFKNAFPDHSDPAIIAGGCDSCHGASNGQGGLIAKGPTVGHPVTNVDCDTCHSVKDTFSLGGIFNHSLVDATIQPCESCHIAGNSINAIVETPTATHQNRTADCGTCHTTETFLGGFVDHNGPEVLGKRCDSCHDGVTATGKPLTTPFYEHMPTTEDCEVCHTPGTFSTGTYDHALVTSGCNSCHNNVIGVGKLQNHIPTSPDTQDCADCHNTTTFVGAAFDHTSTDTSNCLACHDGNISKGKSFGHVATNQNCSTCHIINNGYSTFADTFFHDTNTVSGDCASCHNTGIAPPKISNHIPAQAECSQCHVDTNIGGFASNTFLGDVHTGIISGCEGCHTNRTMLPNHPDLIKNDSHLPVIQDCDVCHTNASFAAPTTFSHDGIADNCSSCHDGNVNNVAAGALGKAQAPTPHPATNADCGACHAIGNNFTDGTFDHTGIVNNCSSCHGDNPTSTPVGPMKNPGHIITTDDCSLCHVPGTFTNAAFDHTGKTDNCAACHGDNGTGAATKKTPNHLSTTEDCSVCHNTTVFAGARFDHTGVSNNCAQCHDGATAPGKTPPPNHVPTNQDCSVCHQTTGFVPGTFDHVGIVDNCVSCHDGKTAKGKSNNHVQTNQDCSVCHSTSDPISFTGAVFDHTGIVNNCASCHDGNTAIGKDAKTNPAHLTTNLDCSDCHTTATFVGGSWVHDSTTANSCDQCHSPGNGATPKSNNHLNTNEQCDVCHTTNGWAPTNFSHSPNGNYPGDHRRDPGCTGCHKGAIGGGINSGNYPNKLTYAPDCAGCHAGDFSSESDHIGGKNGTVSQNRDCAGSGCHKVRDSSFD